MAALNLGWVVADLFYTAMPRGTSSSDDQDLPSASELDPMDSCKAKLDRGGVLVALLGVETASAEWRTQYTVLKAALDQGNNQSWLTTLRNLHVSLLTGLEASDAGLFRAYDLGRALRKTCRLPDDEKELSDTFAASRVQVIQERLGDLTDHLPDHSANAVAASLGVWATWIDGNRDSSSYRVEEARRRLTRQGHLWLAILTGEKDAVRMLDPENFIAASKRLSSKLAGVTTRLLLTYWWQVVLLALAIAGVILAVVLSGKTASVIASLGGLAAALGITRKGVVAEGDSVLKRLTTELWGAELDLSIGDAITKLPRHQRGIKKGGGALPVSVTRVPAAGPDPGDRPVPGPTAPAAVA